MQIPKNINHLEKRFKSHPGRPPKREREREREREQRKT
jgi:uncharacterized short protein YbdD (DUF466 family)